MFDILYRRFRLAGYLPFEAKDLARQALYA